MNQINDLMENITLNQCVTLWSPSFVFGQKGW
jgi:hypothetical protein